MPTHAHPLLAFIPSPPDSGFHLGPLDIHVYGLMYVVGITLAVLITRRRWSAVGGNPDLVSEVAIWAVPFGLIGARIYFDITTPADIPHHWWGVFAIWSGGLGVWGGIAAGAAVGIWRVKRAGANAGMFANAIAPALLVAQAVGRIGNYFNQELFGKPTGLPWALEISPAHRPAPYLTDATFQPSFLYELIFDLALAAALVWLGHHRKIKPWGLFALYVAGYSAYRIFEETIRVDSSEHFLGLRLNFYVATILALAGIGWFIWAQRRVGADFTAGRPGTAPADGAAEAASSPATGAGGSESGAAGSGAASSGAASSGAVSSDEAASGATGSVATGSGTTATERDGQASAEDTGESAGRDEAVAPGGSIGSGSAAEH